MSNLPVGPTPTPVVQTTRPHGTPGTAVIVQQSPAGASGSTTFWTVLATGIAAVCLILMWNESRISSAITAIELKHEKFVADHESAWDANQKSHEAVAILSLANVALTDHNADLVIRYTDQALDCIKSGRALVSPDIQKSASFDDTELAIYRTRGSAALIKNDIAVVEQCGIAMC